MSSLFLHPGYPKTATTTLQNNLFRCHPDIAYWGRCAYGHSSGAELINDVLNNRDDVFFKRLPYYRSRFAVHLRSKKPAVVFSEEAFLAGWPQGCTARIPVDSRAQRLQRIVEEVQADTVHVVIIIRNQQDMLLSRFVHNYHQMIRPSRITSIHTFLDSVFCDADNDLRTSLCYSEQVALYESIFGRDRVTVFLFEDFLDNVRAFVTTFCRMLGVDAHAGVACMERGYNTKRKLKKQGAYKRPSKMEQMARDVKNRYLNAFSFHEHVAGRLLIRILQSLPGLSNNYITIPEAYKPLIADYYRESNRKLEALRALPLTERGYPT